MLASLKARKWQVGMAAVLVAVAGAVMVQRGSRAPEVSVAQATLGPLSLRLAASGLVEAESEDLSFKGQGKIASLYAREGDRVAYGEVLARLDSALEVLGGQAAAGSDVIQAPYDGAVVEVYRREGSVMSPGMPVLRFVGDGRRWVTAFLDSDDSARLRTGQQLQCRAGGYLSEPYELKIVAIGREAVPRRDLPGSARQVRVRCEPVGQRFPLVAGTEVDIDGDIPLVTNALLVPTAAVSQDGPSNSVWLVRQERVHRQPVQLGANNFELIEIREGLSQGETVVVHGKDGLEQGQRVRVTETLPVAAGGRIGQGNGG